LRRWGVVSHVFEWDNHGETIKTYDLMGFNRMQCLEKILAR
jgi:hypothetical protein